MPGTLAAKVRAKYPGVYDDLDDAALEQKVLAKYPQYADLTEPLETPKAQPARTWGDTASDLLPAVGGTIGGLVGGKLPGISAVTSGIGGMAGEGYRQLAQHGSELLPAIKDVASNLLTEPMATLRGAAEGVSAGAHDAGIQGAIQAGSEAIGGAVTRGATKGAQAVYRGYLKPSLAANKLGKANEIVQTAIDEALPMTRGGVQKGQAIIGELRAEVDDMLAKSPGTIDLKQIADRVRAFARTRYFKPGVDTSDYQMALGVADSLDAHPALGIPAGVTPASVDVPLSAANESKRGLYTSIKEAGFGTPQGPKKSAEKYAANQLKQGLEQAAPAISPLNARESKLIDAAKAIAKAVERDANQNPIYGVKTMVAGGAAGGSYMRGDDPTTSIGKGLAVRALLTPGAQSHLAIVANRLSKELGIGAASAARLAAYVVSEPEQ